MNHEELRSALLSAYGNYGRIRFGRKDPTDADLAAAIKNFPTLAPLRLLDVGGTQFGDESLKSLVQIVEADGLPELRTLDLGGTKIRDEGIEALAGVVKAKGLPRLLHLWLGDTEVGDEGIIALADAVQTRKLPQLRALDLSETQVRDRGIKALAGAIQKRRFPRLRKLQLSGTHTGDNGVEALAQAAEKGGFLSLLSLGLADTQVGDAGVAQLARAADQGFPRLLHLSLAGTRVTVANEELTTLDPQRIFRALQGVAIAEAKVVVLGEPDAGKTWLCKRFFLNKIPSGRVETHDIELIRPNWKPRVGDLEVNLRVWDFGGQHVLHGTHEMFLTQRSVVILVLDVKRSLRDNRAEYWQKLVCHCAGSGIPTIVVVSQCDEEFPDTMRRIGQINPAELQYGLEHAPLVIQKFSALDPLPPRTTGLVPVPIAALRSAITVALEQSEDVHKKISPETARMKNFVERKIKDRALISLGEYQKWCRDEKVDDSGQSILRTLHNFGSVFFFGLTEKERRLNLDKKWLGKLPSGEQRLLSAPRDSILSKWIVNPRWLTWSIYEVVRHSDHAQRMPRGVISFGEIERLATRGVMDKGLEMPSPDGPTYVCKILQLTGLCWEQEHNVYLFPRGLANGSPYGCDQWPSRGWWEWGFLPEDSFHRFVVRMHEREEVVKGGDGVWHHWRDAVVIEQQPGCRAVVLATPARGRIEVRLDPTSSQASQFSDLCEFVGDVFEKEIVKKPAKTKQLPSADAPETTQLFTPPADLPKDESAWGAATYSPLEYAAPIVIYRAIESHLILSGENLELLPNRSSISTWPADCNKIKGKGRLLHIKQAIEYYAKYYHKRKGRELVDDERESIVLEILKILGEKGR